MRGPEVAGPVWTDHGDGTATDATTGLTWTTAVSGSGLTPAAAVAHSDTLGASAGDYRIPTMAELVTTIDYEGARWADEVLDVALGFHWTSTHRANRPADTWALEFEADGGIRFDVHDAATTGRVRCVRTF